jgi:hypothetical protein
LDHEPRSNGLASKWQSSYEDDGIKAFARLTPFSIDTEENELKVNTIETEPN